jgi:hypothetical protein
MPLTFSQAIMLAQIELNYISRFSTSYSLLPEKATETRYGWLIPFNLAEMRFVKGYEGLRLAGNAPFFVNKLTGEVSRFSSVSQSFEDWLKDYAKRHEHSSNST